MKRSLPKKGIKAAIGALTLGAVMGLMGACTPKTQTTTEAGSRSGGDTVTLELWHIQSTDPFPGIIQGSADRFMAANPNVKVNITMVANDAYKQKLAVAMSSGRMPDIFISWSGGPMNEYAKAGTIADLTAYMNAQGYKDTFLDAAINQATYQGKMYGVPVENVAVCTVFYNKEIFARYGFQIPTTIRQLEAICDTLVQNGIKPFSLANKTQWTGSMYFMHFAARRGGIGPFAQALEGTGSFEDPSFVYAGTKIQEWVNKGYYNTGFNGLDEDSGQSRQLLYTGDAAMTIMGSWFISTVYGENPEFAQKIGLFNFPADESGVGNPNTVIGTIGDNFYHVASTSKAPDKAFELITYLLDEQAVTERIAAGRIPPLKEVNLSDPLLAELFAQVQAAPDMQLWYDQSLSPEVAEVHKTTSQEIFGGTMSPETAAQRLQAAQAAYLSKR
ncbi:MAG: extracellular solute-binding protein [Treponema sp.]|jgi:raffinose/stachyose/melibiose transport system substrate-binding protein|nr:extracellular solute-binding protein [Treponema sp.]